MTTAIKEKFTFSGHETFTCRHLWLKKGYDFIVQNNTFQDQDAVVKLGVGKNMVSAIRYWMKAFGILDSLDNITDFGHYLLRNDGWDPYLENQGTLWLLHYQLCSLKYASLYSIVFNLFRREKALFDKDIFFGYLEKRFESDNLGSLNRNTIDSDFNIFSRLYSKYEKDEKDGIEELTSKFFSELNLLQKKKVASENDAKKFEDRFQIAENEQANLPHEIFLFALLNKHKNESSISFKDIENGIDGPGLIFCINSKGILNKIENIVAENTNIIFNDQAGIKEMQIKGELNPFNVLNQYYEK